MIGSRYVPGGAIEGWPLGRHLMSRGVNTYARCLLGLRAADCSGAFRCYRTSLLAQVDFDAIRSRGYSFQEEILWHLKRLGAPFRRDADHVRRSPPRHFEDQRPRGLGRVGHHPNVGTFATCVRFVARRDAQRRLTDARWLDCRATINRRKRDVPLVPRDVGRDGRQLLRRMRA